MSNVRVSDYALLRFLERAGRLDVESVRADLERALERAGKAANGIGGGDYIVVADGMTFVVRNRVVTTVMSRRSRRARGLLLDHPGRQ